MRLKKFNESFESDNIDELKDYIKTLEEGIIKRDELIYSMVRGNSHGYQYFMMNKSMGIDELRKAYKTEEILDKKIATDRIKLLSKELK